MTDDEGLRQAWADRLRRRIEEALSGEESRQPQSPREFTDAKAREAAEETEHENGRDDAQPADEPRDDS
jgi:hypothetical protein